MIKDTVGAASGNQPIETEASQDLAWRLTPLRTGLQCVKDESQSRLGRVCTSRE